MVLRCHRLLAPTLWLVASMLVSSAPAASAGPSPIKHFIMSMLENRAFDHRLGWLKQLGFPIDGLDGTESNPMDPANPAQGTCKVYDTQDPYNTTNGGHSYEATLRECFGSDTATPNVPPPMNGFAWNNGNCLPLGSVPVDAIPVSQSLLTNFAVIDRWYPGFPGPTEVNRMFVHSAQSAGYCTNPNTTEYIVGYPQESLFARLTKSGISWRIYMMDDISTVLFFRDQRNPEALAHYRPFSDFAKDCREGNLAQYSVIEPRFFSVKGLPATDEHPEGHSIHQGELMMKHIYDSIRASPLWNQSALLFTYDEHGGLYDHVPPPNGDVPPPVEGDHCIYGGDPAFDFRRLGVRVPAVLVSPWVPKGLVEHEPTNGPMATSRYEHSSVPATVHDLFGSNGYLTARDAWAASLLPLFNLTAPRTDCPETMPEPPVSPEAAEREAVEYMQPLNDFQISLIEGMAALNGETYHGDDLKHEFEGAEYASRAWRLFKTRMGLKA